MAFVKTKMSIVDQFPTYEDLERVKGALQAHPKEDLAKVALKHIEVAEGILHKTLAPYAKTQEENALQNKAHPPPPPQNLKEIENKLLETEKMVEKLLTRDGSASKVAEAHAEHVGLHALSQAIADVARKSDDEVVVVMGNKLKKEAESFAKSQVRAKAGLHPGIDESLSKAAQQVWWTLDMAFDVLGMLLMARGITFDTEYAKRPTISTPLRLKMKLKDPKAALPAPKTPKSASPAIKKATKPAKKAEVASTDDTSADGDAAKSETKAETTSKQKK